MGRWQLGVRELGIRAASGTRGEAVPAVRVRKSRRYGVQWRNHIASHLHYTAPETEVCTALVEHCVSYVAFRQ